MSFRSLSYLLSKLGNPQTKKDMFLENKEFFLIMFFKKISLIKVGVLIKYSSQNFFWKDSTNFRHRKMTLNFEIFDKVVHNFDKPDEVII